MTEEEKINCICGKEITVNNIKTMKKSIFHCFYIKNN